MPSHNSGALGYTVLLLLLQSPIVAINSSATATFSPRIDISTPILIQGGLIGTTTGIFEYNGADYINFYGSAGGNSDSIPKIIIRNNTASTPAAVS